MHMRKLVLATILLASSAILLVPAHARADQRPFGLGLMLGAPTGLSGKLYFGGKPFALDFGLGWIADDWYNNDGLHIHADVLWHPVMLARTEGFNLPFYFGVGGRLLNHSYGQYVAGGVVYDDHDTRIGVRVPVGILFDFTKIPLDVFIELALVIDFIYIDDYGPNPHDHNVVDLNGAVGIRYYF
jgi:hypothetical protein